MSFESKPLQRLSAVETSPEAESIIIYIIKRHSMVPIMYLPAHHDSIIWVVPFFLPLLGCLDFIALLDESYHNYNLDGLFSYFHHWWAHHDPLGKSPLLCLHHLVASHNLIVWEGPITISTTIISINLFSATSLSEIIGTTGLYRKHGI